MRAILECNAGVETAYGADRFTKTLNQAYSDHFERDAFVFPVPTGTAGNGLALGAITPSYGTIFCHEKAHIVTTEGGAPEFYSGGARLALLPGEHNKISIPTLEHGLRRHGIGNMHRMAVSALSLTQATEAGVVYQPEEIGALSDIAHKAGMKVHLDGARFANALVHLSATPAEITWKVGVDILTFGTTKNGTMNAEAVITFDPEIARVIRFMHKRAGHLYSKMRYMAVQLLSYLENDLWRRNAASANQKAVRVADALRHCPNVDVIHPVHVNEVFAIVSPELSKALKGNGIGLRPWSFDGKGEGHRMVMSYCDCVRQIQLFEQVCQRYAFAARGNSTLRTRSL